MPSRGQKASTSIGGALGGAGTGATLGSLILPGVGTAAGAIIGGLIGLASGFFGSGDTPEAIRKKVNRALELDAKKIKTKKEIKELSGLEAKYPGIVEGGKQLNKNKVTANALRGNNSQLMALQKKAVALADKPNKSKAEIQELSKIEKNYPEIVALGKEERRLAQEAKANPKASGLPGSPENPELQGEAKLKGSESLGYPAQELRFQKFTPEQQLGMSRILNESLGGLTGNAREQRAREGFKEQTIPSILERFAGMGSKGSLGSGALSQSLAQAGRGLERDIAAHKEESLERLLGLGLTPQYSSTFFPGQAGTFNNGNGSGGQGGDWKSVGKGLVDLAQNPSVSPYLKSGAEKLKEAYDSWRNPAQNDSMQAAITNPQFSYDQNLPNPINNKFNSYAGAQAAYNMQPSLNNSNLRGIIDQSAGKPMATAQNAVNLLYKR